MHWIALQLVPENVSNSANSSDVTVAILQQGKRLFATTPLNQAVEELRAKREMGMLAVIFLVCRLTLSVTKYTKFVKDFPINSLLLATEITAMGDAIKQIFDHMREKTRANIFPLARTLRMVYDTCS